MLKLIKCAIIIFLIDLIYLCTSGYFYKNMVEKIQGGAPLQVRIVAAIPVYLALAYLVTQANSVKQAAITGFCVYLIYDMTCLFLFKDYSLWLAGIDVIWGTILFAISWKILEKL